MKKLNTYTTKIKTKINKTPKDFQYMSRTIDLIDRKISFVKF